MSQEVTDKGNLFGLERYLLLEKIVFNLRRKKTLLFNKWRL